MKRFAFLYNPAARGGNSKSKLSILKNRIDPLPEAKLFRSKREGDISHLIDREFDHYDVFVACGGDGTIQEVASMLIHTEKSIGIIPMGTGNDLCKTLQIPTDLNKSIDILVNNEPMKIDVGRCNDFIFLNVLGLGFDGLTNRFAVEMKGIRPLIQYAVAALRATIKHQPFTIDARMDDETISKEVIMMTFANGRVEGGAFWVAPDASITDGQLNVVTIRPIAKWIIPFLLPLFLVKKSHWIPHVESVQASEITLKLRDGLYLHADGEAIKNNTADYAIQLLPKALNVICGL